MTIPIGFHELNETLTVQRRVSVEDPYGGTTYEMGDVGHVRARISQPTTAEQIEAQRAGAAQSMIVHMRPDADVRRGDTLVRDGNELLRVKFTVRPSEPVYLRADCELVQSEGDQT